MLLPALHRAADAGPRRAVADQRHAALPGRGRRRRAGRRPLPGAARRRGRVAAAQLVLHPAAATASPSPRPTTCWRSRIFVLVAVAVSWVVDLAARRTRQAARAGAEAADAGHAGRRRAARRAHAARAARAGPRELFGLDAVSAARGRQRGRGQQRRWPRRAAAATPRCRSTTAYAWSCAAGRSPPSDRRVLDAFAAQAAVALSAAGWPAQAAGGRRWPRRTGCAPRCSPRSATTCVRRWPPPRPRSAACAATDVPGRRSRPRRAAGHRRGVAGPAGPTLVDNLLDMSRLQAGALGVTCSRGRARRSRAPGASSALGPATSVVRRRARRTCPTCWPTRGCWSGCWSTCCGNACASTPPAARRLITASALGDRVEVRVVDRGPGHAGDRTGAGVRAFQRLGDRARRHRRRARPGPRPRLHRGDGRHPRPRGHPRRRSDDGPAAAGGRRADDPRPASSTTSRQLLRALRINLRARDYEVRHRRDGAEALPSRPRGPPDVVVLDLGLPDLDGVEVIHGLRGWTNVPVIVLSAAPRPADKVEALDAGRRRLRDQAVRRGRAAGPAARGGPARRPGTAERAGRGRPAAFTVDLAAERRHRATAAVQLTPTEWQLLEVLAAPPGRLVGQSSCCAGVGPGVRDRDELPAALPGAAAHEAGARAGAPAAPAHRAGAGRAAAALTTRRATGSGQAPVCLSVEQCRGRH